uniref:CCHC-type domain-containing protein n=1 Tax=Caenorhabditis japonica TaxID=281687 RepID=A0A8R1DMB5_CAEJA
MDHPPQLSCEAARAANPTSFRDAVIKDLHLAHNRITDVYESVQCRIEELRVQKTSGLTPTAGASVVHALHERGQGATPADSPHSPRPEHALPPPTHTISPQGDSPCNQIFSAKEGKPSETDDVVTDLPIQQEKGNLRDREDMETEKENSSSAATTVVSETDETSRRQDTTGDNINTQTNPIVGNETRAQQDCRNSRSNSATRRVTRSMTANAPPRVNVCAMKTNSSVPMFSGTTKENFHTFMRHFTDHLNIMQNPSNREVRNLLLTVLTDFARDKAEEVLEANPEATYEDICKSLRSQYENQYTNQARLDAIKGCFQYDQEPVQDYYQRIRAAMRDAQTGTNRQNVLTVALEAFIDGLQPEIRFQVEMRQSSDFEEVFKDAIFAEKALNRKVKSVRTNETLAATNRQQLPDVYAQAVQQHQAQFRYVHNNPAGEFYDDANSDTGVPGIAAFAPRREVWHGFPRGNIHYPESVDAFQHNHMFRRNFDHNDMSLNSLRQTKNETSSLGLNRQQLAFLNAQCWYCGRIGHNRQDCRTRTRDRFQGTYRTTILDPPHASHRSNTPRNHSHQQPLDSTENHHQPTIRVIGTNERARTEEQNRYREQYEEQLRINKVQENRIKDMTWRLHAYQMGQDSSGYSTPNVNIITPLEKEAKSVAARPQVLSYVTAQVPITANGHPCYALIDTGANITITSESFHDLFCSVPMLPPTASSAIGLGGNSVCMVGSAFIRFGISKYVVESWIHYTKGTGTPSGPKDYTFIIGNDVLSQLPIFQFDYAKGKFHIGNSTLPLGLPTYLEARQGSDKLQLNEDSAISEKDQHPLSHV